MSALEGHRFMPMARNRMRSLNHFTQRYFNLGCFGRFLLWSYFRLASFLHTVYKHTTYIHSVQSNNC